MKRTIYALKATHPNVYKSLKAGEGRFGWSYIATADLRQLKKRIETDGWDSLSEDEIECYKDQVFLLDLKENDYVVYINVPEWGNCTVARVRGPYEWRFEDDDFNHRFAVDPESVYVFDRNDIIVHPALRSRLKLQGRWWRISLNDEFDMLLDYLKRGGPSSARTPEANIGFLLNEIQPDLVNITERIHHTHPNYDLEFLIAEIFKEVPGVKHVTRQGGAADHGADIIVKFESGLPIPGLEQQHTLVIQVKSFEGKHWDTKAVQDVRRAFQHYPEASMGLIVSTAKDSTEALEKELDKLREDSRKPVALLIGPNVAAFLLRFGAKLLA